MSDNKDQSRTLAEVKAAAEDLVRQAAGADITESDVFPYGVSRIAVSVRAGDIEIALEISGPDHGHGHEEEAWIEEDDDLFDDED